MFNHPETGQLHVRLGRDERAPAAMLPTPLPNE